MTEKTEYGNFVALTDRVLSVPHSEIKRRDEEYRAKASLTPQANRRGPKRKIKPSVDHAPNAS
jgi:hypothetical protein